MSGLVERAWLVRRRTDSAWTVVLVEELAAMYSELAADYDVQEVVPSTDHRGAVDALERLLEADPPTDLSPGNDWREARAHARSVIDRLGGQA